jgi:hypothetical protein
MADPRQTFALSSWARRKVLISAAVKQHLYKL